MSLHKLTRLNKNVRSLALRYKRVWLYFQILFIFVTMFQSWLLQTYFGGKQGQIFLHNKDPATKKLLKWWKVPSTYFGRKFPLKLRPTPPETLLGKVIRKCIMKKGSGNVHVRYVEKFWVWRKWKVSAAYPDIKFVSWLNKDNGYAD